MKLFRITKTKYVETAWSGVGAEKAGGRWNSKGHKAVYLASTISLAQLEILVHIERSSVLSAYSCLELDVPDNLIVSLDLNALPRNWQEDPAPDETQELGDQWLEEGDGVALLIPSTIVPQEMNAVLNPLHPSYEALVSKALQVPLVFDLRLLK